MSMKDNQGILSFNYTTSIQWKSIMKNTFINDDTLLLNWMLCFKAQHTMEKHNQRILSVHKGKQRNWKKKKSLDLLLHERSFFLLCEVVLSYSLYLVHLMFVFVTGTFKCPENKGTTWYKNKPVREKPKVSFFCKLLAFQDTAVKTF